MSNTEICTTEQLREYLLSLAEKEYGDFQSALLPTVDKECVIGIRTPILRKLSAEVFKNKELTESFLLQLPHRYYEENNLHAFLLERIEGFDEVLCGVEKFLPYVDNWGTCDCMAPRALLKNKVRLLAKAKEWAFSNHTYTVRYGIGCLMRWFLDEDFEEEHLQIAASIKSGEYCINMMRAWYFATALAKQRQSALAFIESKTLDAWTHNKTIQKARESFRISNEDKQYLKTLKM